MSAMLTVAAAGTAFSIYNGVQQGKAARAANAAALAAYQQNQAVANELKKRQQSLVDRPLEAKIEELSGKKVTAAGQMALDRFNAEMSASDRAIAAQAPMTGEGVAGGRELTNRFRRAQGIAGINLEDQAQKNAQLGGYLSMAQQTPGWAQVASGANSQMGAYQQNQAMYAQGQEASAYGSAARGLSTLADMYASYYYAPAPSSGGGAPAPSGGPAAPLNQGQSPQPYNPTPSAPTPNIPPPTPQK